MAKLDEEESGRLYMSDPKAKSVTAFIEALTILARYMDNHIESKHFSAAGHDVFYVNTESDEDGQARPGEDSDDGRRLVALGWHLDSESDGWAYFT